MGTTKEKRGDDHIIFHVGKEFPEEGSNFMLVPGIQKAQGRGVYFSDNPRLKYSGGEAFKKEVEITPIFCVPMSGIWIRGKNKKNNGEISYHSNEKIIALFGLRSFDGKIDNIPVRYYYPSEVSFFQEPDTKHYGRHITSQFSERVLGGQIDFNEAIKYDTVSPEYYSSRGAAKAAAGYFQDAIMDFTLTIKLLPFDTNPYMNRGLAYLYLKDYQAASDDYSKVIEIDPYNTDAYLKRGVTLQYLENIPAACEDWKKASELGSEKARTYLDKYCSP